MKQYFKNFKVVDYTLPSGQKFKSSDLNLRFKPISSIRDKYLTTYMYELSEGERPDMVAESYYGNPDFAWLVLLSGDLNHYLDDFPLTESQLVNHIETTYGMTIAQASTTEHHRIDGDGNHVVAPNGSVVTIYEYESRVNDSKRYIKLISKEYLLKIIDDMETFFKSV